MSLWLLALTIFCVASASSKYPDTVQLIRETLREESQLKIESLSALAGEVYEVKLVAKDRSYCEFRFYRVARGRDPKKLLLLPRQKLCRDHISSGEGYL
jgi:hypothetical protein